MTVEDSDVYGIVYPNGGFIVISSQKIRKVTVQIYHLYRTTFTGNLMWQMPLLSQYLLLALCKCKPRLKCSLWSLTRLSALS